MLRLRYAPLQIEALTLKVTDKITIIESFDCFNSTLNLTSVNIGHITSQSMS